MSKIMFTACLSAGARILCGDSESPMAEKSELAMNLSSTYKTLADTPNSEAWLEKAKCWHPRGHPSPGAFTLARGITVDKSPSFRLGALGEPARARSAIDQTG
jgi:hypothetical protein